MDEDDRLVQASHPKAADKEELIKVVVAALLRAARETFGYTSDLEARFDEETGRVDLFVFLIVVEEVTLPEREVALRVALAHGIETSLGEELGFQLFWSYTDEAEARQQEREFADLLGMKRARSKFARVAPLVAKQALLSWGRRRT